MVQFPAANAGAIFQVAIKIGKFHGIICATTPKGSLIFSETVFASSSVAPPSSARITPAKYRKWSIAKGKSAAIVSRIGLPLSQVSARASSSRFSSILSAIFHNRLLRVVAEATFHDTAALCAASNASSTSAPVERAILVKGLPSTGEILSKYSPPAGATHSPPIKFSYCSLNFGMSYCFFAASIVFAPSKVYFSRIEFSAV